MEGQGKAAGSARHADRRVTLRSSSARFGEVGGWLCATLQIILAREDVILTRNA